MNRHTVLIRNLIYLYSSEIGTKLIAFVIFLLLVNSLGDVQFGQYSFAMAFVAIFTVIIDAGMIAYSTREIAQNRAHYSFYFFSTLFWKIPLIAVAFIAIAFTLWILQYDRNTFVLVGLAGVVIALENMNALVRSFFQAFEKMQYLSFLRFLEKLVLLGVIFEFIRKGAQVSDIFVAMIGVYSASLAAGTLLAIKHLPSLHWTPLEWVSLKRLLWTSIPFALFNFFGLIYLHFDTVMISKFYGDAEVGWYNAAYQPILVLYFVAGMLMTAIYPVMSDYAKRSNEQLKQIFLEAMFFLAILGLPMGMGIMLIADRIVPLAFGVEYEPAIGALKILGWVLVFAFFNSGLSTFLNAVNRQIWNLWTTGLGLVFNVGANFYFIPKYGINGAAMTTLATEILVFLSACLIANQVVPLSSFIKRAFWPILITILTGIFISSIQALSLPLIIGLAVIIYAGLCMVFGVVGRREWVFLLSFFRQ